MCLEPTGAVDGLALALSGCSMLLNTILQEVLSRSYLFQTIRSHANATWAILISSVFFALIHIGGLQGALLPAANVFCAGVLFAVAYYVTGNLWLPISLHFVWNCLLGPLLGMAVSGQDVANNWRIFTVHGPALATGGVFGIEGSLIVTLVTGVGIVVLLLWSPHRTKRAKSVVPNEHLLRASQLT
jgi:membrane protease YdiL (CAAX protease family)